MMRNNLAAVKPWSSDRLHGLVPDLNRAIMLLAPCHEAKATAPITLHQLAEARQTCAVLPVWSGASDATIYRDPKVNHAFRAWHDATHASLPAQHSFTLQGEAETCEAQCRELLKLWPRALPLVRIIRAEIIGQATYAARFGTFPANQAAFIEEYLTNGLPCYPH